VTGDPVKGVQVLWDCEQTQLQPKSLIFLLTYLAGSWASKQQQQKILIRVILNSEFVITQM
jgi:hypothetical protein